MWLEKLDSYLTAAAIVVAAGIIFAGGVYAADFSNNDPPVWAKRVSRTSH